jgi:alkylation response protein AidB-like acyl-CoA dehydrogenase
MLSRELDLPSTASAAKPSKQVLEVIDHLVPVFAGRSARADKTGRFPVENIADIHNAGLHALRLATKDGGAGLSSVGYCAVMARLAVGDASTALAFNMHSTAILSVASFAKSEQKQKWVGRLMEEKAVLAALGSEPNLKPFLDGALPRTKLVPDGMGYRLTGLKSYSSFGPHAKYLYVSACLHDRVAFAIVDAHADGISRSDDWDVTGMRGTQSVTTRFTDVWVEADDLIFPPDLASALLMEVEFALGYAPIYLGLACAAADRAFAGALQGSSRGSVAEANLAQQLGELVSKVRPAWLASVDAAQTGRPGKLERARAIVLAKAVGADVACSVAEVAFRIQGGRSLITSDPVGRAFRDVQAAQVMAFSPAMARNLIGLTSLGRPPYHIHSILKIQDHD